ncbi:MFS transporter [Dyadobacter sp. 3J3]|uniref:MFS transporter n=1 Tax=Dyadobacter sp. 3J3 TaxID=2606600 RepID=UPI00190FB160|nr:MFS transporter [Dyadobacter sp. 3J3]
MISDNISRKDNDKNTFIIAWVIGCIFYFMEYAIRSSPAVMIHELSNFYHITELKVSSILGTYYYTYAITSLISGIALDRIGGKYAISFGIAMLATGCFLFSFPYVFIGDLGRLLQGAGSAFAFTGCVYLASHGFQAKKIATAIGFTQSMGMLGGFAGQFVSGPLIQNGLSLKSFWTTIAVICFFIGLLLFSITPSENKRDSEHSKGGLLAPYKIVFSNAQSYLSGIISGLLFAPTTIFAMTWGVAFFQQDRNVSYHDAVLICSMVPLGWCFGSPLLGWLTDKIGKRKPVLIGGIIIMIVSFGQLFLLPQILPSVVSMFIFGTASGAAMIPYTIIKEANPENVKGSATGGINFITFGVTSLLGPLFSSWIGKTLTTTTNHSAHFKSAGFFFLTILLIAAGTSFLIKETGHEKKA